ncbi:MAG: bacillithiol biosynthesis deacetylase BshB1 [Gemmatimonadetes bacterium]|nr:bacillithiol biosynthesis deacetylase BshB1 [Gemmatimonadota bacterium]
MPVDVLAVGAHPDDVELTCGGTLAKLHKLGRTTAILDLTRGEMGSRGTPELRATEAAAAAAVLGVSTRENLGLPDSGVVSTPETREQLARVIRRFAPRIVIAPAPRGNHPDHSAASKLIRDAVFVSGLAKVAPDVPKHRPVKIVHAIAYREDHVKPTFVVDISDELETKLNAVRCFASQFDGALSAGEAYPTGDPFLHVLRHQAAHYGSLIRRRFGEPFFTYETMRVDDITTLDVSTF